MSIILIFHFKNHWTFTEAHVSSFGAFPATVENRNRITKHARDCEIKLVQRESDEFILITIVDAFLTNIKNTLDRKSVV